MPWFSDFPITRKDPSGVWDGGYPLFFSKEEALLYAKEWAGGDETYVHAEPCTLMAFNAEPPQPQ